MANKDQISKHYQEYIKKKNAHIVVGNIIDGTTMQNSQEPPQDSKNLCEQLSPSAYTSKGNNINVSKIDLYVHVFYMCMWVCLSVYMCSLYCENVVDCVTPLPLELWDFM